MTPPDIPSRREIWGWCFYDFANSSYSTVISLVAYAVWFKEVVCEGGNGELLWGLSISASMLLIGVVSPYVGAIADASAAKKQWLFFYTVVCIAATGMLFTVGPGDVAAGMTWFIIANIGFAGSLSICNGFLPEITNASNVGRISGYGYALGYAGGTLALILCMPLLQGGVGPENSLLFRTSFVVTALFYAVFSLPTFLWLRERAVAPQRPAGMSLARFGYARLAATFRKVRSLPDMYWFFAAFLLFNDGVETVIYFSAIFAREVVGFTMGETVLMFMAVQITALAGSVIFGHMSDRIGHKPALVATLILWCAVCGAAFAATTKPRFWVVALVAGLGLGSAQACSRGLMRLFVPAGRDAEYYGFFAISQKFSAVIGPLAYGAIATFWGDQRIAIASVMIFFIAGLILLARVNVARGAEAARGLHY